MDIIDSRRGSRRTLANRRITDRRTCPYQFGSPEWVENIQKNYLAWPKSDRRMKERRTEDRRVLDRRQQPLPDRSRYEKEHPWLLLAPEERELIKSLYLNDME
ncbi:MAG: hypothetical protein M8364_17390 [Methylobacter sp.]|jgi:hypothetical protein|uniref:hypothetical protein n=1 Tax=Methylobacter TaxID=429 RepID=UPI0009E0086B|nr:MULTISPECIES: hypothetical protein [Methylobacter]MCL7422667.1 hypothetical protein [Methylobacter sp.]